MLKLCRLIKKKEGNKVLSIRVLAIINPTSGKGDIKNYIKEIRKNLEEQNMQVNIQITKKEYNAKNIVADNIEEADLILVCGGDGTFNETVSAIMDLGIRDVSIAYIPMGTTNDLARSLDMPIKDISITKKDFYMLTNNSYDTLEVLMADMVANHIFYPELTPTEIGRLSKFEFTDDSGKVPY